MRARQPERLSAERRLVFSPEREPALMPVKAAGVRVGCVFQSATPGGRR